MVTCAGVAALSWELLWQLHAGLSLGVSAVGAAVTLAATMGGMTVGSVLMGRYLERKPPLDPVRTYGFLELVIGLSGLVVGPGFAALEAVDAAAYQAVPGLAMGVHLLGIVVLLGPPTMAMGATVPLFGLMARERGTSIAVLYGLNTAGASLGVLLMGFVILPALGVSITVTLVAMINLFIAAAAILRPKRQAAAVSEEVVVDAPSPTLAAPPPLSWRNAQIVVFVTGLATFALEVAWFRAMRSTFQSTTDSFAVILASVLIPLAIAARLAPIVRRWPKARIGWFLAAGAVAILVATPLVERFGAFVPAASGYGAKMLAWLGASLAVVGPAILLLGIALPWILEEQRDPRRWGRLYAINTFGAIVGAIAAAWLLLPTVGFAASCWVAGGLVALVAVLVTPGAPRYVAGALAAGALAVAIVFETGIGSERAIAGLSGSNQVLLAYEETPDAAVSVIEMDGRKKPDGAASRVRTLVIDGFQTASERRVSHYMRWMGHLPMVAHPDPKNALIICFGTGQTVNAVRREGAELVRIAELNEAVLRMAKLFDSNEKVLEDEHVKPVVMDGRAWLRRTTERYDVVTLEPMPPYFAASNALYSKEFYELVASRLNPGGVVAQWVPFHLMAPYHAASSVTTFRAVFPDSVLWRDPKGANGILVGRYQAPNPGVWDWPGMARSVERTMTAEEVRKATVLDPQALERYARLGTVITDDNQLLAYHGWREMARYDGNMWRYNLALVEGAAAGQLQQVLDRAGK